MMGIVWFVGLVVKEKDGLRKARERLIESLSAKGYSK